MEPTTEPAMGIPQRRTYDDIAAFRRDLQTRPGEWVEYSTHASRNAARSRIGALRRTANFRDEPDYEFSTRQRDGAERCSLQIRYNPKTLNGPQKD